MDESRAHRVVAITVAALLIVAGGPTRALAGQAEAVQSGRIEGRVVDAEGFGLPGLRVQLEGAGLPAPKLTLTIAPDGAFRFDGLPAPAAYTVSAPGAGPYGPAEAVVEIGPTAAGRVELALRLAYGEQITVTDTRQERLKRETPASVHMVTRQAIDESRPTHPGQIFATVPGVWVNVAGGGEGHQTAIRHPLTTNPVYLFLEDGVPTRSTGFFNHNALYEVNVPRAEGIEVTKGPGSALYGSDAIGGVINVSTRSALERSGLSIDLEGGRDAWYRTLVGAARSSGTTGVRGDLNVTRSDGFQDATEFERVTGSLRWDRVWSGASRTKAVVSYSTITGASGSPPLGDADLASNPRRNLMPISLRAVDALRASFETAYAADRTTWSVIPYYRYNATELLPHWSLAFDPQHYTTTNHSFGLLAKASRELGVLRGFVAGGIDIDLSPGGRLEHAVIPTRVDTPDGRTRFADYTLGAAIYDYDVTFLGVSPYLHAEVSPSDRLRLSGGLRLDGMRYDYRDRLMEPETPRHRRPADGAVAYTSLSPKLGATYRVGDGIDAFASYRRGFRVPSESQLFRPGSTENTIDLAPVKAHHVEAGLRASPMRRLSLEASVYQLDKRDDILSYRDPLDGRTHAVNAGRTRHTGVELGVQASPVSWLQASAAWAAARHTYEDWLVDPSEGLRLDGRRMETAPQNIGSVTLLFMPNRRASWAAEWSHLGAYWLDAANTQQYEGHTLLNLRARVRLGRGLALFGRVLNATDERYAESGSFTLQRGRELAPGMPRAGYLGIAWEWLP